MPPIRSKTSPEDRKRWLHSLAALAARLSEPGPTESIATSGAVRLPGESETSEVEE